MHDLKSVTLEVEYFLRHLSEHTIFIFDDIDSFDIERIEKLLQNNNFKIFESKERKASFEYKSK